jgi:hypothetical protein
VKDAEGLPRPLIDRHRGDHARGGELENLDAEGVG